MFRYVALMWAAQSSEAAATAERLVRKLCCSAERWETALTGDGVQVLVADSSLHFGATGMFLGADTNRAGVVLGEIFERSEGIERGMVAPHATFGAPETEVIIKSEGRALASSYWGNFVAIVIDPRKQAKWVFNDPCGTLPCHFALHCGVNVIFSCLGDCRDMGLVFALNWEFVRARAVNSFLEMDIPPYLGVASVRRGECARFDHEGRFVSRSLYWHPSTFDRASEHILEPVAAARLMRATVRSVVHSMASRHSSVLSQLSGGLDSSVVLGCLAEAPNTPVITCYTDYVPNAVCDERRWARIATRRPQVRHIEVSNDPSAVVYEALPVMAPSMEPVSRISQGMRGPFERKLATEHGATVVFTGEGGDSSFCSTSYIFAVNHSIRRFGLRLRTLRIAALVATRRDRTIWGVLARALREEIFGANTRMYRQQLSQLFSSRVRSASESDRRVTESWMSRSGALTQETLLRLGTLASPPNFYNLSTSHHDQAPYAASPLCAQPVFEICMRIPVDVHFDGGRIRGLARRAFAREVPKPILRRQWKDRPLSMIGAVIQKNLPFIRETLLEGSLMKQGILDRGDVEPTLLNAPNASGVLSGEILNLVDLELWVRSCA